MVSIGLQRELAANTGLDTNFVWTGGRAEERRQNLNSSINPATGANYTATGATTDVAHLPFPSWGPIAGEIMLPRVVRLLTEVIRPIVVVAAPDQEVPPLPAGVAIALPDPC